jgi:hypothetical protein
VRERAAAADPRPPQLNGVARLLRRIGPAGMVIFGAVVAIATYWSASRDDAVAKTQAANRMAVATGPLATTSQEASNAGAFSTRQALQSLYGAYDPHLDGVFWTVSGAPGEWAEWNGRPVFIKPLISRTDETGTRHVLVTNSVEVRDGLVVKQGAACRECKSLLGAAFYERRGDEWVLVTEHRFMKIAGAWGAPPKVSVDFPRKAGVEVRIENAAAEPTRGRNSVHAVILHGGAPAASALPEAQPEKQALLVRQPTAPEQPMGVRQVPAAREAQTEPAAAKLATAAPEPAPSPARSAAVTQPAAPIAGTSARSLVSAALDRNDEALERISKELRARPPERGNRTLARSLNERGLALSRAQNHANAAAVFRQAHAADPGDAEIRENLGFALLKAGQLGEAESATVSALEIGPARATAWGSLGYIYAKQGRREDAIALLRAAHRVAPDPSRVLQTYARQAETENDPRVRAVLAEAVTRISTGR